MSQKPELPDLNGLSKEAWISALDVYGEDRGYFEPVGPQHSAVFCDEDPVLLVSFDEVGAARARPNGLPLGLELAERRGWSSLTLLADGPTWYRDKRVFGYFDRLVDDGFFEDFDRVVFLGAGMGGYGACAFSVAAPGATVLAIQPRATLDPARTGWDNRDFTRRRLDFTDRYGYAPQMVEAAERAFLFYDPAEKPDAIHAAFFTCDNSQAVRMRYLGADVLGGMIAMGALDALLDAAGSKDGLSPVKLYSLLRKHRRTYPDYVRGLVTLLDREFETYRLAKTTRYLVDVQRRRRLTEVHRAAMRRLFAEGLTLPPALPRHGGPKLVPPLPTRPASGDRTGPGSGRDNGRSRPGIETHEVTD